MGNAISSTADVAPVEATTKLAARLQRVWEDRPGIAGFLGTVDHKRIGIRYIVTAFAFLLIGGLEAAVMRWQLVGPNRHLLTPDEYNQLFSMHGITMIFLYAGPVLSGFSNYLWPLMFGARDMAMPRVNALSYWIYLFAGLFIYASFALGVAPNDGWFNYVPYANATYNPGPNIDFYALGLIFLGISTTAGAVNFIVTFLRMRAPGMSLNRLPIMAWSTLTVSIANVLVIPCVSLAFFLLWADRNIGTHFFDVTAGGQTLLWQHLFWMFGHPWVYAIVLPAMGMASDALPTFCRRPLIGYWLVALATMATMAIGFGVWVHHMFATGLSPTVVAFFSVASIFIAVPSAIAVFAWIATIWDGRLVIRTPFLFFAAMIVLFVIGGVSGFMTASVPVDWQLTDTYFIVAHIHYVLIGINLFAVVGAIYYWFPKMTGRMLSERLGRWNFWVMFVGFNVGFFPMHISGLLGMPRRVYTYPEHFGWTDLNLITTIGSYVFAVGVLLIVVNVLLSLRSGARAPADPWGAGTLEWSVASPPPPYNFTVIPTVASRLPLWEAALGTEQHSQLQRGPALADGREAMATSAIDAAPRAILKMPSDSYLPVLLALALAALFTALLLEAWVFVGMAILAIIVDLVWWLQPRVAALPLRPQSPGAVHG